MLLLLSHRYNYFCLRSPQRKIFIYTQWRIYVDVYMRNHYLSGSFCIYSNAHKWWLIIIPVPNTYRANTYSSFQWYFVSCFFYSMWRWKCAHTIYRIQTSTVLGTRHWLKQCRIFLDRKTVNQLQHWCEWNNVHDVDVSTNMYSEYNKVKRRCIYVFFLSSHICE